MQFWNFSKTIICANWFLIQFFVFSLGRYSVKLFLPPLPPKHSQIKWWDNFEKYFPLKITFLFELCAILKFRQKKFYWLKWIYVLVFSLPLKASPGKKFFGPPPKKLVEKPFLGHFWLKIGYSCPDNFEKPRWKFLSWHLVIFWRNFPKGAKTFQRDWIWMYRSFQSKR